MPDTFFTTSPHWTWYIILYFYIGGIAGGSIFLAALLRLAGRPIDRPIIRLASYVGFVGALISGLLLTVDLGRPERFWHMLIQSKTGLPMFKGWSPMSFGSWGVLSFGFFTFLAVLGALYEDGRLPWAPLRHLSRGGLAIVIAVLAGLAGFFLAGYTGVLLAVTNRPAWADSPWLGMLFLFSGGSTAAAFLILLARWRRVGHPASIEYLSSFDEGALILELIALVIFLATLGAAIRVFLNGWGVLLVLGVVIIGILLPLAISSGRVPRVTSRLAASASLVLFGGFLLRVVVLLSSHGVHVAGGKVVVP